MGLPVPNTQLEQLPACKVYILIAKTSCTMRLPATSQRIAKTRK